MTAPCHVYGYITCFGAAVWLLVVVVEEQWYLALKNTTQAISKGF